MLKTMFRRAYEILFRKKIYTGLISIPELTDYEALKLLEFWEKVELNKKNYTYETNASRDFAEKLKEILRKNNQQL